MEETFGFLFVCFFSKYFYKVSLAPFPRLDQDGLLVRRFISQRLVLLKICKTLAQILCWLYHSWDLESEPVLPHAGAAIAGLLALWESVSCWFPGEDLFK